MAKITRGEFLGRGAAMAAALGMGALPGCTRDDRADGEGGASGAAPDLVLINATVHTVDDSQPTAEAFAVKNGRFVAVGSTDDVRNLVGRGTRVIDAAGMTVVPGFIDTHIHPNGLSEVMEVDLDLRTIAEIKDALRRRAAETPPGFWVDGFKYDDTKVRDGRQLNRQDLDEAVPNHPVSVSHRGGHMGWYNSKALELAGLTREVRDPEGGRYGRDANGELTGYVAGGAAQSVFRGIAQRRQATRADRQAGVKLVSEMMSAAGLTSVQDGNVSSAEEITAYQDAREAGEMKYRVYLSPRLGPGNLPLPQALVNSGIRTGFGDEWIRFGRIKFSLDGSASGRTMRISEPYIGRPGDYGILYMDQQELNDGVEWAHRHGCQAEIHANGDVAIDMALQAYERAEQQWPRAGGVPARHQIEHCSLVNPGLLRRIAAIGVIPSAFTTYIYYHGEKWAEYGDERMQWMFAKRSFLDHGIKVSAGSDYVPGPFQPLMGIQSMVTRTDYEGRVWGANQRISVDEALRISTMHGAYASFEEDLKGSITAGKLADFVVLEADPYTTDPMQIKDIPVRRTVIGGRTVHEA